jgi:uncharacterized protein (TIGR02246 family)
MARWLTALYCAPLVFGQTAEIRSLLQASAAAWNRGDLAAFVSVYKDSPETTFIGREVTHGGTEAILERYRRTYPNRDVMGTLSLSEIEVRTLSPEIALASGKYELKRSTSDGGDASGRFTLVIQKTRVGWKIIHDHSS